MPHTDKLDEALREFAKLAPNDDFPESLYQKLLTAWDNGPWTARREYVQAMLRQAAAAQGPILECGSGLSTVLLGIRADQLGKRVWSLEHIPTWIEQVASVLERFAVQNVELCQVDLRNHGSYSWYTAPLERMPTNFELVVCDGPPGNTPGGRYGLIPIMRNRLKPGCVILLDDADRAGEKTILTRWAEELGIKKYTVTGSKRPFARLVVPQSSVPLPSSADSSAFLDSVQRQRSGGQTYLPRERILQQPAEAAVIIPTILRSTLFRAVESVFRQDISGTVQVLIGVDKRAGDPEMLDRILRACPANRIVTLFDLGYSTSRRNGGLHPGGCGGTLRTIMSYAANSRYLAYLDDDNWFREDHLSSLREAIEGHGWAFSQRWYVDAENQTPLCVDRWESVGPNAGAYKERFGGFVDPNCLMIDKSICEPVLRWWSIPLDKDSRGMSEDRNIFQQLKTAYPWKGTEKPTNYYLLHASDCMHSTRMKWFQEEKRSSAPKNESVAQPAKPRKESATPEMAAK
jgi:hypothetical protein